MAITPAPAEYCGFGYPDVNKISCANDYFVNYDLPGNFLYRMASWRVVTLPR
jgi:hypothetical protein